MSRTFKAKILPFSVALALAAISSQAIAADDFNIPFVNAAGLGEVYTGGAAIANDASTTLANPAGLVRIPNQQIMVSGIGILGTTEFTGTSGSSLVPGTSRTGTASSDLRGIIPQFYYALPLTSNIVLGVGASAPFGLGTDYGAGSIVQYTATSTQINVIDVGPAVGVKINDHLSLGLGLDADRLDLTLNSATVPFGVPSNTETQNNMSGWGYGFHAGALYQFTDATRVGINYSSKVVVHASGSSQIFAPGVATPLTQNGNLTTSAALPPITMLSAYHDINPQWAVMGSVTYLQWNVFDRAQFNNIAGAPPAVIIPFNYHNTFNYGAAVNYKPTDKWLLKTGVQILQAPGNAQNRLVGDPTGPGAVVGLGAHYQQNHYLGYDLGYAHAFYSQTNVNNTNAVSSTVGNINTGINVFGAQVTWNIT